MKCKLLTESWVLVHCNIYDPIIHSYWVLTIFAKWVKPSFHKYHWAPDTEQIVPPPLPRVLTLYKPLLTVQVWGSAHQDKDLSSLLSWSVLSLSRCLWVTCSWRRAPGCPGWGRGAARAEPPRLSPAQSHHAVSGESWKNQIQDFLNDFIKKS